MITMPLADLASVRTPARSDLQHKRAVINANGLNCCLIMRAAAATARCQR